MAAIGLDTFKTWLNVTGTAQDARLQMFLDHASARVGELCQRNWLSTTYPAAGEDGIGDSGYYSGNGSRYLVIRQRPITSVVSLFLDNSAQFGTNPDGSFATATQLTEGVDFAVHWDGCLPSTSTKCSNCGIIERIGGVWPSGVAYSPGKLNIQPIPARGNIKISYVAGYTVVPQTVRDAILQLATLIRRNSDKGGNMSSESLGGYSYSLMGNQSGQLPELGSIRDMLSKYVELPV